MGLRDMVTDGKALLRIGVLTASLALTETQ